MGALMLFSTLAFVFVGHFTNNQQPETGTGPLFVGTWQGFSVYQTESPVGPFYALDLGGGYLNFRVNPFEADQKVYVNDTGAIYQQLMTSSVVYLIFDQEENDGVNQAVFELTRFFRGKPFVLETGISAPYVPSEEEIAEGVNSSDVPYYDIANISAGDTGVYIKLGAPPAITLFDNNLVMVTGHNANDTMLSVTKLGLIMYRLI